MERAQIGNENVSQRRRNDTNSDAPPPGAYVVLCSAFFDSLHLLFTVSEDNELDCRLSKSHHSNELLCHQEQLLARTALHIVGTLMS